MKNLFLEGSEIGNREYRALRDDPKNEEYRYRCEKLWSEFSPFADTNFPSAFANDLHSRYWEMYLGVSLLRIGFDLQPRSISEGPDLQISLGENNLCVEAIAPDEGTGPDAVPKLEDHNRFEPVPDEKIILRFTNAISEKWKALRKYQEKDIISNEDHFVIAVNGHGIQMVMFDSPIQTIIKAVYPIGDPVVTINTKTMEIESEEYKPRYKIKKNSGADVDTNTFLDPSFSDISGVLYSKASIFDPIDHLGDDFLYIHNSIAERNMDLGWLGIGIECFVDGDELFMRKF